MRQFHLPDVEIFDRGDIYTTIWSKKHSPGDIIDIIKDHNYMHFGTSNLGPIFNYIILYCYASDQPELAKIIYTEFKHEIDISHLVFLLMDYKVEPVNIDGYFEDYDKVVEPSGMKLEPSAIFIKVFREYKVTGIIEYFEMIKGCQNFIGIIGQSFIPALFQDMFKRKMFTSPDSVELLKILMNENTDFAEALVKAIAKDLELIELFLPKFNQMFTF